MIVKIKTNDGEITLLNKPSHLFILDHNGYAVDNAKYIINSVGDDELRNDEFLGKWLSIIGEDKFKELVKR